MLLPILIIITISVVIAGILESFRRAFPYVSFLILILVFVLGWGGIGSHFVEKSESSTVNVSVLRDGSVIHLSDNGNIIKTLTDVRDVSIIGTNSTIEVTKIENKNMYGGLLRVDWKLKNDHN
jgi:hypothetical protein